MNRLWAVAAVLAASLAACDADEIRVGKLPYKDVKITGMRDGAPVFEVNGLEVTKPLADITRVRISGSLQPTRRPGGARSETPPALADMRLTAEAPAGTRAAAARRRPA